jgi:hypothetical protein
VCFKARVVELERIKKSNSPAIFDGWFRRRSQGGQSFSVRPLPLLEARFTFFRFAESRQANQHITRRAKGRYRACENFIETIIVAHDTEQSAIACETNRRLTRDGPLRNATRSVTKCAASAAAHPFPYTSKFFPTPRHCSIRSAASTIRASSLDCCKKPTASHTRSGRVKVIYCQRLLTVMAVLLQSAAVPAGMLSQTVCCPGGPSMTTVVLNPAVCHTA